VAEESPSPAAVVEFRSIGIRIYGPYPDLDRAAKAIENEDILFSRATHKFVAEQFSTEFVKRRTKYPKAAVAEFFIGQDEAVRLHGPYRSLKRAQEAIQKREVRHRRATRGFEAHEIRKVPE
jgi:hypothetical protein